MIKANAINAHHALKVKSSIKTNEGVYLKLSDHNVHATKSTIKVPTVVDNAHNTNSLVTPSSTKSVDVMHRMLLETVIAEA